MVNVSQSERPAVYCGVCDALMVEFVDSNTGVKYFMCPGSCQLNCDNDYLLRYADLDKRIIEKFKEDYYSILQKTLMQTRLNLDMILPFLSYIRQKCSSLSTRYNKPVSDWRQCVEALYNRIREKEEEILDLKNKLDCLILEWVAGAPDIDQIDTICSLISRAIMYRDRFTLVYNIQLFEPNIEDIAELLGSLSALIRQAEEMKSNETEKASAVFGEEELDYD